MSIKNFIKIDVHLFHNNKFKLIKSIEKRNWVTLLWIRLLTEAGLVNDKGLIYLAKDMPYSIDMLSDLFENSVEDIKSGLDALVSLAMIKIHEDNIIEIINWCKYQEPKRKAKKVKEEITEAVENQGTDKCDTTEVEDRTNTDNAAPNEVKYDTTTQQNQNSADTDTTEISNNINIQNENVNLPKTMNFSFIDDDTTTNSKKNQNSVKPRKNVPAIETNGDYELVNKDEPENGAHDGEYKPKGELLWEINFAEDDNFDNPPTP